MSVKEITMLLKIPKRLDSFRRGAQRVILERVPIHDIAWTPVSQYRIRSTTSETFKSEAEARRAFAATIKEIVNDEA